MQTKVIKDKLPTFIKRITLPQQTSADTDAESGQRVVLKAKRAKKKSRGFLRVWERLIRRSAEARAKVADDYLERHEHANRKRRDGWLRDYAYNLVRSSRKGAKALKLSKILG